MEGVTQKALRPTLWRTCRILANRKRLELFRELLKRPGQSVAAAAALARIPPDLASKYLRELNARGLLVAKRVASRVLYSAEADASVPQAHDLLKQIKWAFKNKANATEYIFRQVTAFTHPRRISIVASLSDGRMRFADLRAANSISTPALARHLLKLNNRGIIRKVSGGYKISADLSPLASSLVSLSSAE